MLEGCIPFPPEAAARYLREGYWQRQTIAGAIAAAAARGERDRPDHIAVCDSERRLTYGALIREAAAFAGVLARHGIAAGDRIIIVLPNCVEFASLLIGALEIGAIPVMALAAFRKSELEYLAAHSGAKAIAIAPVYRGFDHAALARDLRQAVPQLAAIFATAPAPGCINLHEPPARECGPITGARNSDPLDVALFLLSGGTTGRPKLIPRTHTDYLYNARAAAEVCGLGPDARILLALPAEHNFALACPGLLGALLSGATAVFAQATNPRDLAATIERERITHLPCVPTLAIGLLDLAESERPAMKSLRVITVGGARLGAHTAQALTQAFAGLCVQQVLGMAEGMLCYTRLGDPEPIRLGTQGRPLSPADEIRIVDASGRTIPDDAPDGVGELWCRGPYTIRGYYRESERNREAFTPDGFYRTGDLVRRGAGGNLIVEGRIKDLINRGGEKISAEEIEGHLLAHHAILHAAVVAMPDEVMGEKACAYVTLRPRLALALDALRDFMAERGLARFKWPERLEIIAEMPLTNVGKIKKAALRRDLEGKLAAEHAADEARRR
jgi:2,3-dihydroxybenzoate-AMP ligase